VPARRRGRPARPETELLAEIKKIIAGQPTYGYRRVHALIRRRRQQQGGAAVNVKRVYRIMKAHGLLLEHHTGMGEERRHDGRVAVDRPDTRWCSDGFEIGCDNGERVRVAFTLDCCDREAIAWVATTGGIDGGDIRGLMIDSVERRFGLVNRLPMPIEWLSDNGSPYTARETRRLGREIGSFFKRGRIAGSLAHRNCTSHLDTGDIAGSEKPLTAPRDGDISCFRSDR
jgi:putative transposase